MFKLPYDLIITDLEASQPNDRIIEIGATKLLRDGTLGESYGCLVNVPGFLGMCKGDTNKTITQLTGITEEMLAYAPKFPEVINDFHNWAIKGSKNVILASWGSYDTQCLIDNCKHYGIDFPFRKKSMDVKSIVVFLTNMFGKKYKSESLTSMLECYNIEWDNTQGKQHRASADAVHTAKLLQKIWKGYEKNTEELKHCLQEIGLK